MKRMSAKQKRHQVRKSRAGNAPKKRRRSDRERVRVTGHGTHDASMFAEAAAIMTSMLTLGQSRKRQRARREQAR